MVAKTENFKYLLEQGIATYCQRIVDIGDLATKELEIEVALENMQEKIAEYEVTFSLDSVSSMFSPRHKECTYLCIQVSWIK